jgi:FkbM family methyltransferase
MLTILRTMVKRPLNFIGLDLVRHHPRYSIGGYGYLITLNIKTVIDVGAHTGEFARMIRRILPGVSIFSFEPLKAEFQQLQRDMRTVTSFKAFNYAVGNTVGTVKIHRSDYSQSSSLLRMGKLHKEAFPESAGETLESVEVRTLDDLLSGFELEPEIAVKIDVQGYEDRVIAGATNIIGRTKAIIVEVSFRELYEGQALFDDIYHMLSQQGFIYMGNVYQLLNPLDGVPLQADALFVRS